MFKGFQKFKWFQLFQGFKPLLFVFSSSNVAVFYFFYDVLVSEVTDIKIDITLDTAYRALGGMLPQIVFS